MRLVCPNCGATYEVPDDVIPEGGRDVQCSNCNNTWFQLHAGADTPQEDGELTASLPEPQEDVATAQEDTPDTDEPLEDVVDEPADDTAIDDAVAAMTSADDPSPRAPKPTMSPEAEEILRQEAEYAAQMRAADTSDFETQPDLGLDAGENTREAQVRDRLSKLKGINPEEIAAVGAGAVAAAGAKAASRRDLLPDIEEINSTLNSADHETEETGSYDPVETEETRRKGFRFGFIGVLLIFAILIALYLFAPQLKSSVPALGGILDSYTNLVDGLRLTLDRWLSGFTTLINGWMEQATDGLTGADETPADPQ